MNREQTIARIAVMQAWVDKREVQWRGGIDAAWQKVETPLWSNELQYRIKPETVAYRRALMADRGAHWIRISNKEIIPDPAIEGSPYFVRWLDNDWVEVEV